MEKILGLKIDVDTYRGMQKGVPSLLTLLDRIDAKASFYLSVGPDASGRAIFQFLRNPRFIKKMWRTNALGLYGLRTALYGTLLPSPNTALSFPQIVQKLIITGQEVQFHAWDHRRWQDELPFRSRTWIEEWFEKGMEGFNRVTGQAASSFGAPAWLIDDRVIEIIEDYRFCYLSCTRASAPFIHEKCNILEIPSDLPCLEETGVENFVVCITDALKKGGVHVLPLHAEVEGGIQQHRFMELLNRVLDMGYALVPLQAIHSMLSGASLPVRRHRLAMLKGRAVPCAV